jgi:hypothetical protein
MFYKLKLWLKVVKGCKSFDCGSTGVLNRGKA